MFGFLRKNKIIKKKYKTMYLMISLITFLKNYKTKKEKVKIIKR